MVVGYYKQVTDILRQNGFVRVPGGKGSHEKWRGPDRRVVIVSRAKSRITANKILKEAGLSDRV